MKSFDSGWQLHLRRSLRIAIALVLIGLCAACATSSGLHDSAPVVTSSLAHPDVSPVPRDHDLMLSLLAGQFALQESDLAGGAQHFAKAAMLTSDPAIAKQATQLALATRNWDLARSALVRWQALAPHAPGLLQARAWIALGSDDEQAAYADLVALADGEDKDAWRLIAQTLVGAPDKAASARVLARLATEPRMARKAGVSVAVSQLAWKLGDKTLAEKISRDAVTRFHSVDAYAWAAHIALEHGDKAAARAAYAAALKIDPDNIQLRLGYAALLSDAGDNAAAARALAKGAQSEATYAGRAAYAARADNKTLLTVLYRELEADATPRDDGRYYLLGQVAELMDKFDDAVEWYAQISEDDEHWFDAQARRVLVLDKQGKTAAALAAVHALQALTATDNQMLGNAYLLEAEVLVGHHQRDQALAIYARALQNLPDDPRLLYARALMLAEQDDIPGAERDLRKVIAAHPDNAEALNALGYTLADRTDRMQEALDLIQRAAKLKPDEPAIIDSLGWVQYRLGKLDTAQTDLRRAYALQPDAEIAAHLGEVLWANGQHAEARKVWEEGRRKDGKNKVLIETIKRLTT